MPKVRRSKKPPPDGWELIEPTLEELEQKMREGERLFFLWLDQLLRINGGKLRDSVFFFFLLQPRRSLTKARENRSPCGRYLKFTIRNLVTYTTCFTGERRSVAVS